MHPLFLSFHTADGSEPAEWSRAGDALLRAFGDALRRLGFTIDYEAGAKEPDWYFAACRDGDRVAVVLTIGGFRPCRWFIGLEDGAHHSLDSDALRAEVNSVLDASISAWPGASAVRWHADHTTLMNASTTA